ncbi:hypothetical protein C7W88_00065 [Novosphingobium sp. THN1]|uniref:hypothetical protein n=1 Tax=Novosphingobium sp. THN1 TaxID=1016987 RepID=UPI000E511EB9|nr:hypothetical protein [Novosphingobium sp. THN1]AXU17815.1 hypothetical protein C7W88_00065 [Novosphingobium sp. THN1]
MENRIKLDEADAATLRHYAEVSLGLEVKTGTNANQLRAKIKQAEPDCEYVPTLPGKPAPIVQQAPEQPQVVERIVEKIVYLERPAQTDAQMQSTERRLPYLALRLVSLCTRRWIRRSACACPRQTTSAGPRT